MSRTVKDPVRSGVAVAVAIGARTAGSEPSGYSRTVTVEGTVPLARLRTAPHAFTVSVDRYSNRSVLNSRHQSSVARLSVVHLPQTWSASNGRNAVRPP